VIHCYYNDVDQIGQLTDTKNLNLGDDKTKIKSNVEHGCQLAQELPYEMKKKRSAIYYQKKYLLSRRILPVGIIYNKSKNTYQVEVTCNGKKETAINKYGEEEASDWLRRA